LGIQNADIVLSYDPDLLIAREVVKTEFTSEYLFDYNMSLGQITIALAGTSSLEGSGVLCEILFRLDSTAEVGSISPLTLEQVKFNGGAILPQQILHGSVLVIIPEISLSPSKAPPLSDVAITGSGFPPNEPITVRFEDTDILSSSTDGNGKFSRSFKIPDAPGVALSVSAR